MKREFTRREFAFGLIALATTAIGAEAKLESYRDSHRECGMCGAHVAEWWHVRGASGKPVTVCRECYEIIRQDEQDAAAMKAESGEEPP